MIKQFFIPVTVDKSHLITIGEKMYAESIELIRELVNNAYDADATEVRVQISKDKIVVEDNGTGMNEKGLWQYFNIGSPEKRLSPRSPKFGRKRIGEFGIGKFASLSAADEFRVSSKKGKFVRLVIFNKKDWEGTDKWELPVEKREASAFEKDGTKVILSKLKREFNLSDVERVLKESVPLRAKHFAVFLNNQRITPGYIPGRRIPIVQKTIYGDISGDIIVTLSPRLIREPGIACKVKGVTIKRELFDLGAFYSLGLNRITGQVNADFLPITSARDNFIKDSPEYQLFYKIMRSHLEKVLRELKAFSDKKSKKKTTKILQEVMKKVRETLIHYPEFCPSGRVIKRRKAELAGEAFATTKLDVRDKKLDIGEKEEEKRREEGGKGEKRGKEKREEKIKPTPDAVMKRFRIKDLGITCCIDHFGPDGPESFSQANVVYINQDYPVYIKCAKNKDLNFFNLARLIMQEIALIKESRTKRTIFDHQSKLLAEMMG